MAVDTAAGAVAGIVAVDIELDMVGVAPLNGKEEDSIAPVQMEVVVDGKLVACDPRRKSPPRRGWEEESTASLPLQRVVVVVVVVGEVRAGQNAGAVVAGLEEEIRHCLFYSPPSPPWTFPLEGEVGSTFACR
jgi:hypothetical protein